MRVRLTRKLAPLVDGIDLSAVREGDTLDLPSTQAELIVREGWAVPVTEGDNPPRSEAPDRSDPKRRPRGSRKPKVEGV